jgi:hypothetical protein
MGHSAVARKTVVNDEQLSVVGAATWEENFPPYCVKDLPRNGPSQGKAQELGILRAGGSLRLSRS